MIYRIALAWLLLFIWSIDVSGQSTISGTLVDAESNQPIPFAHIAIGNDGKGTNSNEQGQFLFKDDSDTYIIRISHIAYEPKKMEIATSRMEAQNSLVIKLQPATVLLKEVAIKGNGYAAEVIAKAYKKALNENQYSSNGKAFFRQKSQINGEYTEHLEAFYFVEYSNQGISNWIIEQGRYARKKADEGNKIIEFQNFSSMTRGLKTYSTKPGDILIPVIPKATEFYGFELKNISHQGGLEIVEIFCRPLQTVQQPGFTGSVFIETNDLQIVKLKGDVFFGSEGIELTQGFKAEDFNLEIEMAYVLDQNNGLPVLDYINANASFKYADNNNNENMMQIASSFFVYENDLKTKHKKNNRKNQFESDQQAISSTKYSKKFWQDNPIVKRTPLEEEIIESFDRDNSFGNFLKR